jgi:hypothetical protein
VERQPVRQLVDFSEQLIANSVSRPDLNEWFEIELMCPIPASVRWSGNDMLIPHQDQDGVYGVKVRAPDGTKTSWPGSQFTHRLYDPTGWQGEPCPTVVICEGESDCWALNAHFTGQYVSVFALPSGAASWKDAWLDDLRDRTVYICMDNDRAGQAARDKLTRKIGYLRTEQLWVPPLYNDAREAIGMGWMPEL